MSEGVVFNIQRFSLHDGPGIRTTVFLKGCPLRCAWCQNPEGIDPAPEALRDPAETVGRVMTAEAVVEEVEKDAVFYEVSGGGVTLSGGDPLAQPAFAADLLQRCAARGFHTAVDTAGHAEWAAFEPLLPHTDLFLFDLKHFDEAQHLAHTGVTNRLLLANLERLAESGAQIVARYPVIPGVNDDLESARRIGEIAVERGIQTIHILAYHTHATGKADRLAHPRGRQRFPTLEKTAAEQIAAILEALGLNVIIGG